MLKGLICCLSGFIFTIGLGLSGMMGPKKVQDFLDITGDWDPSLGFVMIGALIVGSIAFPIILKREKPQWEKKFDLPTKCKIDSPLILGAILFGIGWGLCGLCPGPAFSNLVLGKTSIALFFASMVVGMWIGSRRLGKKN